MGTDGWGQFVFLYSAPRYRFCRKLEEVSFAGSTAEFIVMLLFGSSLCLVSSVHITCSVSGLEFAMVSFSELVFCFLLLSRGA